MSTLPRDCPDCSTRMQPFWLPAKGTRDEIELDRCNDCGGVWFDAGELRAATSRALKREGEATDRQCPACDVPLVTATLGPLAVEVCDECDGTFLEARDLDRLKQTTKSRPAVSSGGGSGFVCDECGERKSFSHARPTLNGVSCDSCVEKAPAAPPEQAESVSAFGRFLGWLKGE